MVTTVEDPRIKTGMKAAQIDILQHGLGPFFVARGKLIAHDHSHTGYSAEQDNRFQLVPAIVCVSVLLALRFLPVYACPINGSNIVRYPGIQTKVLNRFGASFETHIIYDDVPSRRKFWVKVNESIHGRLI
jgi:hypothetical protein